MVAIYGCLLYLYLRSTNSFFPQKYAWSSSWLHRPLWDSPAPHSCIYVLEILSSVFNLLLDAMVVVIKVVEFTIICAISAYHHKSCEFEPRLWWDVLDATLCDKVCHVLPTGRRFSWRTPVSTTIKTDRHDITEILLRVALNTITQTLTVQFLLCIDFADDDFTTGTQHGICKT
jgi:hypothetical protein